MASSERVGIELQLIGRDAVMNDFQKLERMVRTVTGKHAIQLDLGRTKEEMIAVNSELEKYRRLRDDAEKGSKEYDEAAEKVKQLSREYKELSIRAQEYSRVLREHKSFGQVYDGIRAKVKQLGSALTSTGQAMKLFSRPFNSLMRGTVLGAGYKLLNLATSGLSGAFERYDTFKTYAKSLEALGYDASKKFAIGAGEAMTAIENLNESVLGLPTGLDEIVAAQKKYLAASGDMVTATMAAIAANNTFLAQGSDAKDQLRGARQLRNLLSGGEMTKARWQSILESMPLAVKAVGEELGYTDKNMDEFRKSLLEGEIAADDFLKAFLEVGTSGKIKAATDEMKHTFGAVSANIGNAFKRMGENVIKTLDYVLKKATGKDTIDFLLDFKGVIDSFSEGVQSWIKAHPDVILNFIESLKKIDFASFFKGVGDGLATSLEYATKLIDLLGGRGLSVLGKLMTYSGFISTPLTIIGGFLRGIGSIAAGLFGATVTKGIERLGGGGGGLLGGILTKIFGKKGAGEIAKEAASAPKALDTMKNVFSKLQGVLTAAGTIAVISGTTAFASWSIKSALTNIKEIIGLISEIGWEDGAKAAAGMAGFFTAMSGIGYALGTPTGAGVGAKALVGTAIGGSITSLISLFTMGDMMMLKKAVTDFRDMVQAMSDIGTMLKDFNLSDLTDSIGTVTQITSAMNQIREALMGSTVKGQETIGIKALPLGTKEGIKDIAEAITTLVNSVESINALNGAEMNVDNIESNTDKLRTALESLGNLIKDLPQIFHNARGTTVSGDVLGTVDNVNGAIDGITSMMGKLQGLWAIIDTQAENPILLDPIKRRIGNIFEDLGEIVKSYNDAEIGNTAVLVTKMQNFSTAFESIKQIMTKLKQMEAIKLETAGKNGTGLFKGMQSVNKLIGELQTSFNADKIGAINSQIQGFVDTVNGMLDTFNRLGNGMGEDGGINIKIDVSDKITGLSEVINDIHNIDRKVRGAIRSIKTVYHKTITLNIRGKVNDTSKDTFRAYDSSVNGGNHQSRGGYTSRHGVLYRSGGGSVFRPRGTDKIPAMLTEGEYVHRKQAVDAFGIDFMRKVNNLDIRGAMNALLARGGMSASIGRQSIINNTVNNNQRVTQNINTNNPQFARIRASRFAGAL